MKACTNIVLCTIALVAVGRAQTPAPAPAAAPAAPSVSWVLTPTFASQYMFRGVRLGGPAFQPSLEADYGNLALGVWTSTPLANKVPGQSDPEIDPYGSYKITVNDALSIQPGFTWYNYPNAKRANGFYKSTFEPSIAVNYTVSGVTFTPKAYYDMVLKGPTFELNASYALPLKDLGTELDFAGTIGTYKWNSSVPDSSPETENHGDYWQLGVSVPYQIVKDTQKLVVGFAYTNGSDNYYKTGGVKTTNPLVAGRGVVTVSYSITF